MTATQPPDLRYPYRIMLSRSGMRWAIRYRVAVVELDVAWFVKLRIMGIESPCPRFIGERAKGIKQIIKIWENVRPESVRLHFYKAHGMITKLLEEKQHEEGQGNSKEGSGLESVPNVCGALRERSGGPGVDAPEEPSPQA